VDSTTSTPPRAAYQLGSGDKLRVIVFGEEDLSGEFEVDDTGAVSLPLVGEVGAGGRTLRSFEAAVREQLSDGYLKDPRVSVQVINYRPFYIIGEVEKGGEYPFVSGMHLLNAVAVAGGFTYRANTSKVFITRGSRELEFAVTPELRLEPGDVIRVPERFF
jgi:polysaccharide export outer membrane protein